MPTQIDPVVRARDWIDAWNTHDLARVMAHYDEPLTFVSPLVVRRTGRTDGTLRSLDELEGYFAASLGPGSALRFELHEVFAGVGGLTLLYGNHRGEQVAETKWLNEAGRATHVVVHHRVPAS